MLNASAIRLPLLWVGMLTLGACSSPSEGNAPSVAAGGATALGGGSAQAAAGFTNVGGVPGAGNVPNAAGAGNGTGNGAGNAAGNPPGGGGAMAAAGAVGAAGAPVTTNGPLCTTRGTYGCPALDGGRTLGSLSNAERAVLCDCGAATNGGYGKGVCECPSGSSWTYGKSDQATCVADAAITPACTWTLASYFRCINLMMADPCSTVALKAATTNPDCAPLVDPLCNKKP